MIQAGAKELLRAAVQAEVSAFIAEHANLLDEEGRQRLVRHGFLPEREMMTGIGMVPVQVPRVRDRGSNEDGSKIRFRSSLVPPYLRKAKSVEELLETVPNFVRDASSYAIGNRSSNMMASCDLTACHSRTERFHLVDVVLSAR